MNRLSPPSRKELLLVILAGAALPVLIGASLLFGRQAAPPAAVPAPPETRAEEPPPAPAPTAPAAPVAAIPAARPVDADRPAPRSTEREAPRGETKPPAAERGAASAPRPAARAPAPPPAAASAPPTAWERPEIPRHYPHIRIALLAYAGNPMGPFEDGLLRESVDLVVPNPSYLKHIHEVAPQTPQLIYTNTSNLYEDLLTDWLAYADDHGVSREGAFFHAARPVPFRGDSPSSRPVTWFWGVYRGGRAARDLTAAAHKGGGVGFGGGGEALYVGHVERFREINLTVASPAADGWAAALEYPTAAGDDGLPAGWRPLATLADTTRGLTRSGQITFDAPGDWKPGSVGGSARLFYVRFRTTSGGAAPVAGSILGRDFVGAKGGTTGTVPVFDSAADANHDGYLDDEEYARRAPGKDARFLHESRVFTDGYGQMRYSTHPSDPGFRDWCVDYHTRLLRRQPLAGGLFMDNSGGKVPVKAADVLEPVTTYSQDLGAAVQGIARAIAPKPVLANTVGGFANAEPLIRQSPAYFEEFAIRPMSHPWSFFEDLAAMVARRSKLTTPPPYAVLDSHPQKGDQLDPRLQLGTLAYYYLLADPDSTFLMFYGGNEPNTPWRRHWVPAAAYDVGRPAGAWSVLATGPDPTKPALTYKVYRRPYDKALVLFKPLSYARGSKEAPTTGDETATRHDLDGTYRPLRADGTLGGPVTSVSLRNGEGAILVKAE
jgi:hypothetical protein